MFNNCSLYCCLKSGELRKINMRGSAVNELRRALWQSFNSINNAERQVFDAGYNNDDDYAVIHNFRLDQNIIDYIQDGTLGQDFSSANDGYSNIKFLFMGEAHNQNINIAFQKVKPSQVVTRNFHLLTSRDTLALYRRPFLTITDRLDCIYVNGMLIFKSFYDARQVFDLGDYYYEATDADVQDFIRNPIFLSENENELMSCMDQIARKKVASIQNSRVLEQKTPQDIQQLAYGCGINIEITEHNGNHKVVLPTDKKELKLFLKFLDEDLYDGLLSGTRFETNSKRRRQ